MAHAKKFWKSRNAGTKSLKTHTQQNTVNRPGTRELNKIVVEGQVPSDQKNTISLIRLCNHAPWLQNPQPVIWKILMAIPRCGRRFEDNTRPTGF